MQVTFSACTEQVHPKLEGELEDKEPRYPPHPSEVLVLIIPHHVSTSQS